MGILSNNFNVGFTYNTGEQPREHILRAIKSYIQYQQELIKEEYTNNYKGLLRKQPVVSLSMEALNTMFLNFSINILSNWPRDNHIPISFYVDVWMAFMNPLDIFNTIGQEEKANVISSFDFSHNKNVPAGYSSSKVPQTTANSNMMGGSISANHNNSTTKKSVNRIF